MIEILVAMAFLIALGALWRARAFGGHDVGHTRSAITALVYYYLLPALVLDVMWAGDLGLDSLRVAAIAAIVVLSGIVLARLAAGLLGTPATITGAMILAAAWPNSIYLGLPVLTSVLGPEGRAIAVQFDYLAATPLLLTVGVAIAQHYGNRGAHPYGESAWLRLIKVPPLIAAVVGVLLSLAGVPLPDWLAHLLGLMGAAVVPLMLIALGMSLRMASVERATAIRILPVLLIQLLLLPLLALAVADPLGLAGIYRTGAILEAAMPAMVIGLVLCDRYGLDTAYYSATVTVSTVVSLLTLPAWLYFLQNGF